ncbi:MAG: DNA repair protein RecO C-terminal domain-containing protein, partial [Proteobacteria bacterium]|nr:DNA repair protein RecO C-terminal domain-containing protein [Pseudomonadota bacterium]
PLEEPQPAIYHLLKHTLERLALGGTDLMTVRVHFIVRLLRLAGFEPQLVNCAGCGAAVHFGNQEVLVVTPRALFGRQNGADRGEAVANLVGQGEVAILPRLGPELDEQLDQRAGQAAGIGHGIGGGMQEQPEQPGEFPEDGHPRDPGGHRPSRGHRGQSERGGGEAGVVASPDHS